MIAKKDNGEVVRLAISGNFSASRRLLLSHSSAHTVSNFVAIAQGGVRDFSLSAAWREVGAGGEGDFRFFRVTVEMP